jgi:putative DNA primase/helicase
VSRSEERPELRRFKSDPVAQVLENRGVFVAAILTISMAYRAAGCPWVCDPLGSYGEWTQLVRGPLIWLGEEDPVKSMETAREEDPELGTIRKVFAHWKEHIGLNEPCTAFQVIEIACQKDPVTDGNKHPDFSHPEFRDVLLGVAGKGGVVLSKSFGRWLAKIGGRIVGKLRLNKTPDPVHGHKYSLERLSDDRAGSDSECPF